VRGDEARVISAFVAWLEVRGWAVSREMKFIDIYGERDGDRLDAEVKGRTTEAGLDADTMYGQLLRRMDDPQPGTRYAAVAPTSALNAAPGASPPRSGIACQLTSMK
jgi:hypothetical protein